MSTFVIADNPFNNHELNATCLFMTVVVHFCGENPNTIVTPEAIQSPRHGVWCHLRYTRVLSRQHAAG